MQFKNVIIYQNKYSNDKWGIVQAYIPKDEKDYIRCCNINATNDCVNVIDIFDANSIDEIVDKINQWIYLQEFISDIVRIYDANTGECYIF